MKIVVWSDGHPGLGHDLSGCQFLYSPEAIRVRTNQRPGDQRQCPDKMKSLAKSSLLMKSAFDTMPTSRPPVRGHGSVEHHFDQVLEGRLGPDDGQPDSHGAPIVPSAQDFDLRTHCERTGGTCPHLRSFRCHISPVFTLYKERPPSAPRDHRADSATWCPRLGLPVPGKTTSCGLSEPLSSSTHRRLSV